MITINNQNSKHPLSRGKIFGISLIKYASSFIEEQLKQLEVGSTPRLPAAQRLPYVRDPNKNLGLKDEQPPVRQYQSNPYRILSQSVIQTKNLKQTPQKPVFDFSPKLPNIYFSEIKPYSQVRHRRNSVQEPDHTSSLVGQIGYSTLAGMHMNGQTKTNQDSIIVDPQVGIFGVADGHGVNGEKVSNYLKVWIPKGFGSLLPGGPLQTGLVKDAFIKSFRQVNQDIWNQPFDTNLAGSTLVTVWFSNSNKLYSGNVGDSRAVLGRKGDRGWVPVPLTKDHKPSFEEEAYRILRSGGRVSHQFDPYGRPIGPLRVWLKSVQAPGLAMTRSFGDKIGAQAGVIAVPEVLEFTLAKNDKFVVIASDGVWEYMSNEQVISNVGTCFENGLTAQKASEKLLQEAYDQWKANSLSRDDISCLIIYLT